MRTLYYVDLDVVELEDGFAGVVAWATKYGASTQLLQHCGPAGGNPLYRFSSPSRDKLHELISSYAQDEDIDHLFEDVHEVEV